MENATASTLGAETAARPQGWDDCDADICAFLGGDAVEAFRARLGEGLIGVYLHGSLAMGCFHRPRSDLDLLVVVRERLEPDERRVLALGICDLSDHRPTPGDLELSVLRVSDTRRFTHPCPFELHYGGDWKGPIRRGEVDFAADRKDPDLAAHCTVTRARGVRLLGPPIPDVFGPVAPGDYLDAVLYDFAGIVEGDGLAQNPVYGVLNVCRVLQLLAEGPATVASKEEGGHWALGHLPDDHHPVIRQALRGYRSARPVPEAGRATDGMPWDPAALRAFRDFAVAAEAARRYPHRETAAGTL
jgi:streptomycin 3"-adenylyltransferase